MRPRTQIAIPEPKGTEFENFDRLAGMLMRVKPKKKATPKAQKKSKPRLSVFAFRALGVSLPSPTSLPGEPVPRQAASSNLRTDVSESLCISQFAPVVAKRLFVQIPEQVERFHADIGTVKLPLHQTPEIFHRVRMNVAAHVLYRVIDDRVLIFPGQAIVRLQRIAEQCRASLHVLANVAVKFMLAAIRYGERANISAPLHHSESNGLVRSPVPVITSRGAWRAYCGTCHR